ncbi:MAG TPA: SPOR domain-containing protein [Bacteroidales bacterium]|nr:SPOR domain-containing protein [Bacteroidales bacterium]
MKRITVTLFVIVSAVLISYSQEIVKGQDTVFVHKGSLLLDSTLLNRNIFALLKEPGPSGNLVTIEQSQSIESLLLTYISNSSERKIYGYRVRIYFDNKQDARSRSEAIVTQFTSQFPDIRAYASYEKPFFKVTVGDFRTKSEAMQLLKRIEGMYRSVFLVKEVINYPPVQYCYL